MSIHKVTLVGGTGSLGAPILDTLIAPDSSFEVSVLQRQSSKSMYPGRPVKVIEVSDTFPVDEVTEKLRGQDALVISVRVRDVAQHKRLVEAAAKAGVKRVIPADYGSCDSRGKRERELVKLFERKVAIADCLQELSSQYQDFTWSSIVCGHFFDWGLEENFLHVDLKAHSADIVGDGSFRSSMSTLTQVGRAVRRILERPEATANKTLFIQSFCVSQADVVRAVEKATSSKFKLNKIDAEAFIAENKDLADKGDTDAIEHLVWILGAINGNWEGRPEFAMKLLGLEEEDLDEVASRVVNIAG